MLKIAVLACFVVFAFCQDGPPPFLQGAPPAKVQEFGALINSLGNSNDQQIDEAVKQWIGKQSAAIQGAFAKFQAEILKEQAAGEAAHQAALNSFSPAAKAADAKLSAIANNPKIPPQQKQAQIEGILNSLPAAVKAEIEKAMQG